MNNQLIGSILESKCSKIYNHWPTCSPPNCQTGCRYGKPFHKLKVKVENKPIKSISVFADKLVQKEKILPILQATQFIDKRYRFICFNYYGNYHLIDWEELPPKEPP